MDFNVHIVAIGAAYARRALCGVKTFETPKRDQNGRPSCEACIRIRMKQQGWSEAATLAYLAEGKGRQST